MPQAAQEELRRRAVALVGEGRSQSEVAGLLDVSRQSVSEWVRAYRLGGERALAAGRRGRRPGEKTALAPWQQAQIVKAIREGLSQPKGDGKWPIPYAVRRTAWHALDHAWEMEDRIP